MVYKRHATYVGTNLSSTRPACWNISRDAVAGVMSALLQLEAKRQVSVRRHASALPSDHSIFS